MASKMVVDRQARGADVLAALAAHGGEVADELRREVGEAAGGVAEMQATLRRRLEGRLEALVAADEEQLAATGDLAAARRRRDAAARELYRLLVAVRRLAEGLYGAGARELLRIEGRVAQRPVPMLRQARRVMARLADPEMPRPERRFAGATADEGEWAELLAPAIDALAAALESTDMARRRAESTLLAKTEALAAYDLAHGRLARYGEALFELAGLPEYASRLRPRARRRGRAARAGAARAGAARPELTRIGPARTATTRPPRPYVSRSSIQSISPPARSPSTWRGHRWWRRRIARSWLSSWATVSPPGASPPPPPPPPRNASRNPSRTTTSPCYGAQGC